MKRIRLESSDPTDRNTRKRTQLPDHVITPIVERLPLGALLRTKAMSSFWNFFGESILSSETHKRFLKSPWLILPPKESGEEGCTSNSDSVGCRLMNLEENMVYGSTKTPTNEALKVACVGSSHGWLIFLDYSNLTPFLFNPFTQVRIQLPSLRSVLDTSRIEKIEKICRVPYGQGRLVLKGILTAEAVGDLDFGVVFLFKYKRIGPSLVYYKNGNSSWQAVYGSNPVEYIRDIIGCGNRLYALNIYGVIYTWDLQDGCHRESSIIGPSIPRKSFNRLSALALEGRGYLVESGGDMLLVVRFIRYASMGFFRTYKTDMFDLYKLDVERKCWVEVESLGDRSIFVGGNHSVLISTIDLRTCKENSIYFTDDHPFEEFTGRDLGIYSLKDGSVMPVFEFPPKIEDFLFHSPCWLLPASCYIKKASK